MSLSAHRCASCGATALGRRARCPACGADAFAPTTLDGRGTVHSVTMVHRAAGPSPIGPTPYTLVLVTLDAPAMDKVMALAHEPPSIGDAVMVRPLQEGAAAAPYIAEPTA
ncbi:Zn-ribbon domain-containing OB-fold protein [Acuticoccus sp.]|uniref:Zn-ribbon domain-containing OB-fold protein n=1 Tax=Acuticoccus sp. TaxID=1904378 RepID=UPI003B526529